MPEYRHLDTINKGIAGPELNQTLSQTFTGTTPLIGVIYIPNSMGEASEEPKLLGSIPIQVEDFLSTNGSMLRIKGTFKRGAVAEQRSFAITIGSTTFSTSLLIASDLFGAEEASDETYEVSIEIIKTTINTITFQNSVKCITVFPNEEESSLNEGVGYAIPLAPVICFWGTNAVSGSVILSKAIVEYFPIST